MVSHIIKDEHDIEVDEEKKKNIKIQLLSQTDPSKAKEEKKKDKNEKNKIKTEEKKLIHNAEDGAKFTPNPPPLGCFMIADQRKNSDGSDMVLGVELTDKYSPKTTGIFDVQIQVRKDSSEEDEKLLKA